MQQCKIDKKAKLKVSNIYEYVQLHLVFHFFVFIDVISGLLCWDERRQLAKWESLPHNYENYFFLCLHSSKRHVHVDLWLAAG